MFGIGMQELLIILVIALIVAYAMLMQMASELTLGEAARALGVSADTLRRWDRSGKLRTVRDERNRRRVPAEEVTRLRRSARRRATASRPATASPASCGPSRSTG